MAGKWRLCEIEEVPRLLYEGYRVQVMKGGDIDYYFDIIADSNGYLMCAVMKEEEYIPTHPNHEFRYWEED